MLIVFIFYSIGWASAFAVTRFSGDILKNRCDLPNLPAWANKEVGKRVCLISGTLAVISAISMLVWAATHLKWYLASLGWAAGLLLSGPLQRRVTFETMILYVPPMLVFLSIALWIL